MFVFRFVCHRRRHERNCFVLYLRPFDTDFDRIALHSTSIMSITTVVVKFFFICVLKINMTQKFACWSVRLLDCWFVGLLKCWAAGVLGCWTVGPLECRVGVFGCSAVGLLGCWSVGLLGCWVIGLLG